MVAKKVVLTEERLQRKLLAEASFLAFIELVAPKRLLGNIHREIIAWLTREEAKKYQMLLLPRDHMKSALAAFYAAWMLTRDPTIRILYISSTSNLATKQLKFIKDILTSDTYRLFWPEMVNKDEAKREKWTEREISIDDPRRRDESIRDPSIFTAGLTTNIVGLHCDICILDDVVVAANAYTEEGREKVKEQYGYLSSIETGNFIKELVVGTRYHPKDLYNDLAQMEVEVEFDDLGNVQRVEPLFEVFERSVESIGDGTGEFLWPRQQRTDGKWFGFDAKILADKRAHYPNKVHFRAQYYNDPHDVDSAPIKRDLFQYYNKEFLASKNGRWYYKDQQLNIAAAVDFAYSTGKLSDSSAIVVVGVDGRNNYYVLDIDRFKTDKPSDYYKHIFKLHQFWGFTKIRAEVSVAQKVIVNDLKENYIRKYGLSLAVEEYRPTRWIGSKQERILAILEPKYANKQIWHYTAGNCQLLEEELVYQNPAHDDIKDALASAIDFIQPPINKFREQKDTTPMFQFHGRFGGVA